MSEEKKPVRVTNLLEATTFKVTVKCSLPASDGRGRRPFDFDCEFRAMPQNDWEDLVEDATKSEALLEVLIGVDECIPASVTKEGQELTPIQVVAFNPFTCDAAYAAYNLYISEDSRSAFKDAGRRKNSKRSQR